MGVNQNIFDDVDARTNLVGQNRLELLLFKLSGNQRYGINVFKVREVISCPHLTRIPSAHPAVLGLANMRGNTFMVVDLLQALGMSANTSIETSSVIVAEYNRRMQGFLVPKIEHIINKTWEEILPPPKIVGKSHYLTAVTQLDDEIIEILDVEKVLYEITGTVDAELELEMHDSEEEGDKFARLASKCHVLIADDSLVARKQIERTLKKIGISCTSCNDGRAALDQLELWLKNDAEELKRLALVISDVEMPSMDGYTLTREIRKNPKLSDLSVILHTSLSGVFDSSLLDKVQADGFLSKFDSNELATEVRSKLEAFEATLIERGLS